MLAKDHQPLPHPDSKGRKLTRDDAIILLREEQALRKVQHNELIARIEQVAQLTADCRHWRSIAESWQQAAEVSRQPREFYTDYNEMVMNAMQALKTRAEEERAKAQEVVGLLMHRLNKSLNDGALLDNWNEPLDAYGKRILRVILVEIDRMLALAKARP